jgi:hypothetical protein
MVGSSRLAVGAVSDTDGAIYAPSEFDVAALRHILEGFAVRWIDLERRWWQVHVELYLGHLDQDE